MDVIQSLTAKLEHNDDLDVIRCAIVDLIIHYLEMSKLTNNQLALDHLINAVGTLSLNMNAIRQPSALGLKVCMKDIDKAIAELGSNPHTYQLRGRRASALGFDMLLEAARAIHKKVCITDTEMRAA